MVDGLNDIIKDSKITLPDRRYLFMYNSPQMDNFRKMGMMEAAAKRQQDHRILREEVLEQASKSGGSVPDIAHVTAAMSQQLGMTEALREQMEGLAASARREQEGKRLEAEREMERFAAAQRAEAERARIAAEVARVHVDGMAAERDRMMEAMTAAGVVNNNVPTIMIRGSQTTRRATTTAQRRTTTYTR
jgi:uncharacterized membrane protein YqiK